LAHAGQVGVAALREGAQKIERRRGLAERLDLPAGVGTTCIRGEGDIVDDVAAVARQFNAVALFGAGGARFGELAGNAADLHHRRCGGIGKHHRHLQEHAEEVADIIGAMLGKAFGAIAALQQESLAVGDAGQRLLQAARLAGKNQRREGGKLLFDVDQGLPVRIVGDLQNRLFAPTIGRPTLGHHELLQRFWGLIHDRPRR
jgi:hypothetical protein